MANRHLLRSIALQALFEWDFRNYDDSVVDDLVERDRAEFAPGSGDKDFLMNLVRGVIERHKELDDIVEKAARDWPLSQTPVVDRNVLRIGLWELLFANKEEVPARVAINEAIELGKNFGGEKSGKFINGVLGTVYKEMGEPGKDDVPKKKRKKWKKKSELSEEEIAELPEKILAGAVIYREVGGGKYEFGMVHDVFGHWTLSKGSAKGGETDPRKVAVKEVKEEMSLDVEPGVLLGENMYIATDPEIGNMRKSVKYYLASSTNPEEIQIDAKSTGLDDAKWWGEDEIYDLGIYEDIIPLLEKSLKILRGEEVDLPDEKPEETKRGE